LENQPRRLAGNIEILPWSMFIDKLWSGELLKA
jgi:hypothetical protein